jgi:hypothetical protein
VFSFVSSNEKEEFGGKVWVGDYGVIFLGKVVYKVGKMDDFEWN